MYSRTRDVPHGKIARRTETQTRLETLAEQRHELERQLAANRADMRAAILDAREFWSISNVARFAKLSRVAIYKAIDQ